MKFGMPPTTIPIPPLRRFVYLTTHLRLADYTDSDYGLYRRYPLLTSEDSFKGVTLKPVESPSYRMTRLRTFKKELVIMGGVLERLLFL